MPTRRSDDLAPPQVDRSVEAYQGQRVEKVHDTVRRTEVDIEPGPVTQLIAKRA